MNTSNTTSSLSAPLYDTGAFFSDLKKQFPNITAASDLPTSSRRVTNKSKKGTPAKTKQKSAKVQKSTVTPTFASYTDVVSHKGIHLFKNEQSTYLYTLIKDVPLPDVSQVVTDLKDAGYTEFLGYWFHPALSVKCNHDAKLIFKFAVLENINNYPNKRVSQFIFRKDKDCYLKHRNAPSNTVERCDFFVGWMGVDTGREVIRFMGSLKGSNSYGVATAKVVRDTNKVFLRVLNKGPGAIDEKLTCRYNKELLENIPEFKESINDWVYVDDFEIHHALLYNNESYWYNPVLGAISKKSNPPSTYLNSFEYSRFTTKIVAEFMSCIILSVGRHDRLHRVESADGIDVWIKRYNRGTCDIPYAWKSETNYNEIIDWISQNCPKVNIASLLGYDDFIKAHSIAQLENQLSKNISLDNVNNSDNKYE